MKEEKEIIYCEAKTDGGASRVRGWHNSYDCQNKAKYRVTFKNGDIECLCGVHKNSAEREGYVTKIKKI